MKRFLFIYAPDHKPIAIHIRENQVDDDYVASQIKPVLRGLEIGEYWYHTANGYDWLIVRIE